MLIDLERIERKFHLLTFLSLKIFRSLAYICLNLIKKLLPISLIRLTLALIKRALYLFQKLIVRI